MEFVAGQTLRQMLMQGPLFDSLQRLARALETDPAAQERAAREQFGMIRRGELLYRLVPRVDTGDESDIGGERLPVTSFPLPPPR